MRLWIDGQCLQTTSRFRGIGRYVIELMRAIGETAPEAEMTISFNAAIGQTLAAARDCVSAWIAPGNIHLWQGAVWRPEARTGYDDDQMLSAAALAHHVACLAPDIALSASPFEGQADLAAPLLSRAGHDFPWAAIFYDAIPWRFPERYLGHGAAGPYRRRMAAMAEFDVLLAISGFARREALDIHPGASVDQIDAGVSRDFLALVDLPLDPVIAGRLNLRRPFLLYVGALDWRKNVAGAIAAFRHLPDPLRQALQFVVAGDATPADLQIVRRAWKTEGLAEGNLKVIGHVSDAVLVQLYRQADLVIQPSLMEGFGLTALEAMVCGAPVIAANAGALPEVVGAGDALFDPARPESIAGRIAMVLSDPAQARILAEQGRERARNFSWERSARLALAALKSKARKSPPRSREVLRRITLAHLPAELADKERAAQILAAAEPPWR